jgi:altronate hydrolase
MVEHFRGVHLNPADPIVVALRDVRQGDIVANSVEARTSVPAGHKIAIVPIATGAVVRKLGQVIGTATRPIAPGEHVHTHNLAFVPSAAGHEIGNGRRNLPPLPEAERATFQGILRADGSVATRNYIGVLTTVNCSATVARLIANEAHRGDLLKDHPMVDGVVALTHKTGCVAGETGEAIEILRRTVGGYIKHPNFAAVLVIGLGCESNQLRRLMEREGIAPSERVHAFNIQDVGGTRAAVEFGLARIRELLPTTGNVTRQQVPLSHLKVGLQCGGSDGFSAITANPALGIAADLVVKNGGTSILSETPEIYGAEDILLKRAVSLEVGKRLIDVLGWWERYAAGHGETMDSNPSPGNKAGGLTTILEKSLGAAAKGGTSDLVAVYRYAEPVSEQGLVFMDTPGYDPVSATGQVAGGANLIAFTTGRGSCFGCIPSPSIKLATNTGLYRRMTDDMDINCGEIADGTATLDEMGERIFNLMLAVASGRSSKSEQLGYGEDEFAPWHFGATM